MKKVSSGAKVRKTIGNIFVYLILTVLSVIWLFPIVWIVLISFKKDKGMYMSTLFPKEYWLGNYKKLFTDTNVINFPQMFLNTLIIAVFLLYYIHILRTLRFICNVKNEIQNEKTIYEYCISPWYVPGIYVDDCNILHS